MAYKHVFHITESVGKSDINTYSVRLSEEHSLHRPIICPYLLVGIWKAYSDGCVNEEESVIQYYGSIKLTRPKIHHHGGHLWKQSAPGTKIRGRGLNSLAIRIPELLLRSTCLMV